MNSTTNGLGLLILRLAVGAILIAHGLQKFMVTTMAGVEGMFEGLGIPVAGIVAPVFATAEIVAGALLVLGLVTRIAAALGAAMAIGALVTVHLSAGFFAQDGGYEFVLLLAAAGLALALTGAGRFSLDAAIGSRRNRGRA
jgi:putative oxidoreductase